MAAGLAQGCSDSSGNVLKYNLTCVGYSFSRFLRSMVASSLQYGHWKSLNSTSTAVAPGVPMLGSYCVLSRSMSFLKGLELMSQMLPCRILAPSLETISATFCD